MIAAAAIVALGVTIGGLFGDLTRVIHDIIAGLVKIVGIMLYLLSYVFFLIIDFLEITFKRVVGIKGTYSINVDGTTTTSGDDLVLTLINSKTIQNIFWALSIIALFLLVVSVIVAIIRSEYQWDKQGNSKGPIFGKALKALALYFTVPVACIFGVWGASQLLKAVDQATSGGKETYISSIVFSSCATTGNRLQSDLLWEALALEYKEAGGDLTKTGFCSRFMKFASEADIHTALNVSDPKDPSLVTGQVKTARENIKQSIDKAFGSSYGVDLSSSDSKASIGFSYSGLSASATYDFSAANEDYDVLWLIRNSVPEANKTYVCSPYNFEMVYFYYGLIPAAGGVGWGYNHILSIIVSFLILKVLFDITCGVLKRVYELVVLYVISPPVVALMPLDDGSAYKTWVKAFISKTLMVFGGVVAINFFFMLVPVFNSITIFGTAGGLAEAQTLFFGGSWISTFFDYLVRLLFVLAGAFSISSLSKMISGIISAEDATEQGGSISGAVGGMTGRIGGVAFGAAKGIAKGVAKGAIKQADKLTVKRSAAKNAGQTEEGAGEKKDSEGKIKAPKPSGSAKEPGGSGKDKKDDGMGDGKIANFVRNHVTGGIGKKIAGGVKGIGSLYGNALNNATGGELKKGFKEGSKIGEGIGGATIGIIGGVTKAGAALDKKIAKAAYNNTVGRITHGIVYSGKRQAKFAAKSDDELGKAIEYDKLANSATNAIDKAKYQEKSKKATQKAQNFDEKATEYETRKNIAVGKRQNKITKLKQKIDYHDDHATNVKGAKKNYHENRSEIDKKKVEAQTKRLNKKLDKITDYKKKKGY